MAFDPFLYVALAAGAAIGWVRPVRGRWVDAATLATVFGLLVFLGGELSGTAPVRLLDAFPVALLFLVVLLGVTALLAAVLPHGRASPATGPLRFPWPALAFVMAVVLGFFLGERVALPFGPLLTYALYLLLFLVGLALRFEWAALRRLGVPLVAAGGGALAAAGVMVLLIGMDWRLALATSFGFGWYSLAGPLVATRLGATAGFTAFLVNFLRENTTMVVSPVLGSRMGAEGLTALGGATAMDTTFYFILRYGDRGSGALALASGLLLTLAASLLVPAVLPGGLSP